MNWKTNSKEEVAKLRFGTKASFATPSKAKIKRSFMLLEALVAISLLLGVSIGFLEIQKYTIKKIKHQAHLVDAHIAYYIALAELIQGMDNKQFLSAIQAKTHVQKITLKDAENWSCEFEFAQPDTIPPEDAAFKTEIKLKSLTHKEWGDYANQFTDKSKKVTFCITK